MEQFPSESEPGVTSFKGRRQWYESTILEFRFHSLRVRGENSHKNRIATSSSLNSIQYATAKASGLFLGEGLLEIKKERGGLRVDLHDGKRDLTILPDLFDLGFEVFLHR